MSYLDHDTASLVKRLRLFPSSDKAKILQGSFTQAEQALQEKLKLAETGGGEVAIRRYHATGKMTARERIQACLDPNTFNEIDKFVGKTILGDGVVGGWGLVHDRKTFIFAWDFTIIAGTCGHDNANKIVKLHDMALKEGCPLIGINDSAGARIQEGMLSLAAYSRIFYGNSAKLSGRIPQISLIMGNCAGGAVYSPAMTDLIIMTDYSFMAITGPIVLKAATGVSVKASELGGARIQEESAGLVHLTAPDDLKALQFVREFLSFVPQNFREKPLIQPTTDPWDRPTEVSHEILQAIEDNAFDMRVIVTDVLDDGYYFELQKNFAPNISTGFGRVVGIPVGVIANNSKYHAGCLDINSSCKAARFVNFCNLFNIPILNFVDVPGFLPSLEQERGGIIRHGSKLLFAQCVADVPKISLIIRKSFGGAYCVMLSRDIHADRAFALPSAQIAVMGGAGAVDVVYRRELTAIQDEKQREKRRQELIVLYNKEHLNPWEAAQAGKIDDVIAATQLRRAVAQELPSLFASYRPAQADRKYPNIPL
jgi:propionyl-CoA carboxylase beta chain